eukprot:scaffold346_cov387-Prasinococcus_capsulatus_cf.AAC.31
MLLHSRPGAPTNLGGGIPRQLCARRSTGTEGGEGGEGWCQYTCSDTGGGAVGLPIAAAAPAAWRVAPGAHGSRARQTAAEAEAAREVRWGRPPTSQVVLLSHRRGHDSSWRRDHDDAATAGAEVRPGPRWDSSGLAERHGSWPVRLEGSSACCAAASAFPPLLRGGSPNKDCRAWAVHYISALQLPELDSLSPQATPSRYRVARGLCPA